MFQAFCFSHLYSADSSSGGEKWVLAPSIEMSCNQDKKMNADSVFFNGQSLSDSWQSTRNLPGKIFIQEMEYLGRTSKWLLCYLQKCLEPVGP